jgi:hypothetical protein
VELGGGAIRCWEGTLMSIFSNHVADWEGSGYGSLLYTPAVSPAGASLLDSASKASCLVQQTLHQAPLHHQPLLHSFFSRCCQHFAARAQPPLPGVAAAAAAPAGAPRPLCSGGAVAGWGGLQAAAAAGRREGCMDGVACVCVVGWVEPGGGRQGVMVCLYVCVCVVVGGGAAAQCCSRCFLQPALD